MAPGSLRSPSLHLPPPLSQRPFPLLMIMTLNRRSCGLSALLRYRSARSGLVALSYLAARFLLLCCRFPPRPSLRPAPAATVAALPLRPALGSALAGCAAVRAVAGAPAPLPLPSRGPPPRSVVGRSSSPSAGARRAGRSAPFAAGIGVGRSSRPPLAPPPPLRSGQGAARGASAQRSLPTVAFFFVGSALPAAPLERAARSPFSVASLHQGERSAPLPGRGRHGLRGDGHGGVLGLHD